MIRRRLQWALAPRGEGDALMLDPFRVHAVLPAADTHCLEGGEDNIIEIAQVPVGRSRK